MRNETTPSIFKPDQRTFLFACCGVLSLAAHAALLWLPTRWTTAAQAPPHPPLVVQIVLNEVQVEAAPEPEEPPPPPEPEPEPEEERPAPVITELVEPVAPPPVESKESEEAPAVQEEPVIEPMPSVVSAPAPHVASDYWNQVGARIAAGLRYPGDARRNRRDGRVCVELCIESDGRISACAVVGERPHVSLETAVQKAVFAASPLPPPPPELRPPVRVQLPVRFQLR